ncbi:1-phosphatidylinositol 4,5-bisphosphate phosphodiesterase gamma-1-like isoform X2 [Varroa jacobsoni]|uniref:1-phosphatidylinositol 4,5-bisphosphate phosphodiesterase gamma n=1 Tax=Varroa destructor TaxID=109461 RepID=A0A7M7JL66_VARDE|nr:1-phosphatidylinositol 4,5-bisphosphate phosphodiesterase gamma-1-like isoform X2 [Varroa destructor]XP_022696674.1 1-phosphatidylinositol 4,5-bisphosphate phosphodiesterase gamma-1-like isoform X2 [Varroa jacobsoni]
MAGLAVRTRSLPSGPHNGPLTGISEMEQIIRKLEIGITLIKFFQKGRPDKRRFFVKNETRQLFWSREGQAGRYIDEGCLDLREVKEIREGPNSKLFERWPDDAKRWDPKACFVILYGSSFRLKCLSCVATSVADCELWVRGLRYLVEDTVGAPYPLQVERWLRKEFYTMTNSRETVSLKDLKAFLPRINCKLSTSKLKELFQLVDTKALGEIGYDGFVHFYHSLMNSDRLLPETLKSCVNDDNKIVTVRSFCNFLLTVQKEPIDDNLISARMRNFLQDARRETQEPYFTQQEFVDSLFSKENQILDVTKCELNQDMSKPLTHYWISSSHNTYLTGDQVKSESSCEAYVRCLRMGCRCIELDCWDGPDGMPHIYHGHTLTTKIRFIDVLHTIKEHAFAVSEFPLILSIENHCTLPQQRKMANQFQEVFKDMLLTQPIERDSREMPSPQQLRRKIIIKHKKLPEGSDEKFVVTREDSIGPQETDISNSVKNGILYLEDPIEKEWKSHFFMLTQSKMYYAVEEQISPSPGEEEDDSDKESVQATGQAREGVTSDELHFGEKWFHGKLSGGRARAAELLQQFSNLGDGTFLVRESDTFVGDYSLSFWRQGKVNHCRIRTKQERGQTKYYLIDSVCFDTLYSLVTHYQTHPLRSQEFYMYLTEPVPQPNSHEGKEWYSATISKYKTEELLRKAPFDGCFIVRPSENKADNCFALSFRADGGIKHCRIRQEGRLFILGNAHFESLADLIAHFEKHTLYKGITLNRFPVCDSGLNRLSDDATNLSSMQSDLGQYMDPNHFKNQITVKALYDYRAQKSDELSFPKHAIITNVVKQDGGWWKGDYGGKKEQYFPANFVTEVSASDVALENASGAGGEGDDGELAPLGTLQKGCIDIAGCSVEVLQNRGRFVFRITSPTQSMQKDIAAPSAEEMEEWINKIRQIAQSANDMLEQRKEMERSLRLAKELSNLIIYCRSVQWCPERAGNFCEMSSFPETKAERLLLPGHVNFFMRYHRLQFSRVYPKGSRIDSSNYDPVRLWNAGVQMVALNYQTPDRPMQLNEARFIQNGRCGYVLRPEYMFQDNFDPYDRKSLPANVKACVLSIRIIGARHLMKSGRGIVSPYIEVEVIGADYDCAKQKTVTISDNGLNPSWSNEHFVFDVMNPELALLRFAIFDEDMFGEPNFLGHATYPLLCLRPGYRSVPLKNEYSESLELASLLVHFNMSLAKPEDEVYASIQKLRDETRELDALVSSGNSDGTLDAETEQQLRSALLEKKEQLQTKTDNRSSKRK